MPKSSMVSFTSICGAPARNPNSTSSGHIPGLSEIFCCAVDSPRPKVCRRTILRPFDFFTRPAKSLTIKSIIALSSLGTPGVQITRQLPIFNSKPTALPIGLSIIVAPAGSMVDPERIEAHFVAGTPDQRSDANLPYSSVLGDGGTQNKTWRTIGPPLKKGWAMKHPAAEILVAVSR